MTEPLTRRDFHRGDFVIVADATTRHMGRAVSEPDAEAVVIQSFQGNHPLHHQFHAVVTVVPAQMAYNFMMALAEALSLTFTIPLQTSPSTSDTNPLGDKQLWRFTHRGEGTDKVFDYLVRSLMDGGWLSRPQAHLLYCLAFAVENSPYSD